MKRILKNLCWGLLCSAFLTSKVTAQLLPIDQQQRHVIQLGVGFDHSLLAMQLSYARYLPNYRTAIYGAVTQSTSLLRSGNYQMQLGLIHGYAFTKHWRVQGKLGIVYARSTNIAGVYNALGYELGLQPLWYINGGSMGLDLSYQPFIATHIKHSAYWRSFRYEKAADGWFNNTVRTFRIGAVFSRFVNKKQSLELAFKAGYQSNGRYDKLTPPIYFNAYINYRIR